MQIKIFKDLRKYTLTSTIHTEDIELIKKYRPEALKKKDADGNDVFAISYVPGKPSVFAHGVTFGGSTADGGFAFIGGDLPENLPEGTNTYGDYVADKVGSALAGITEFEASIPAVAAEIAAARAELLNGIVEE